MRWPQRPAARRFAAVGTVAVVLLGTATIWRPWMVASPVAFVVNDPFVSPAGWNAALRPTRANTAKLGRIGHLLQTATPLPPLGTAPTPGLDHYQQDPTMGFIWTVALTQKSGLKVLQVEPGVQRCVPGATAAHGCALDWNDVVVNNRPESAPGLADLLRGLEFPLVRPLAVTVTSGAVTIVGNGWAGPTVKLNISLRQSGPPIAAGLVRVSRTGHFSWTGHFSQTTAGMTSFGVTAQDSARQLSGGCSVGPAHTWSCLI